MNSVHGQLVPAARDDSAVIATGATIVLVAGVLFAVSLVLGRQRGVAWRWRQLASLRRQEARHDLLRAVYEAIESDLATGTSIAAWPSWNALVDLVISAATHQISQVSTTWSEF